jgi:hypothetical protein
VFFWGIGVCVGVGRERDGRAEARCEFEELNWMGGVEVRAEKGACVGEEGVRGMEGRLRLGE